MLSVLRRSLVPALEGEAGHTPGEEGGLSGVWSGQAWDGFQDGPGQPLRVALGHCHWERCEHPRVCWSFRGPGPTPSPDPAACEDATYPQSGLRRTHSEAPRGLGWVTQF